MDEHVNTSINTDYASNYWIVVIDCLLQRRIDTVRSLLKLNSEADTEPFKIVDNILRTMPIFEVNLSFYIFHKGFFIEHQTYK